MQCSTDSNRICGFAAIVALSAVFAASGCREGRGVERPAPPNSANSTATLPKAQLDEAKQNASRNPDSVAAQMSLALAAQATDPVLAVKAYRRVLALEPTNRGAFTGLLEIYRAADYRDRALKLLLNWIKVTPNDTEALLKAAGYYSEIQAFSEAEALIRRAAALQPDSETVVSAQALFCYQTGANLRGIAILKRYLRSHPDNAQLLYQLSELQRSELLSDEAEASVREAIRLNPGRALFHRQLGHIILTRHDRLRSREAEQECRKAGELGDNDIDTRYWLATALMRDRRQTEALPILESIAKEDITYEKTAFLLVQCYVKAGRTEEAAKLGRMVRTMDEHTDSMKIVVDMLRKHPNQPDRHRSFAAFQRKVGSLPTAIASLRYAVQLFPSHRELRSDLKEALAAAGRIYESNHLDE